jgi:hypothetical protein
VTIPAAGHSNYAKYSSQRKGSPILDALLSPTLEALPLDDFERLRLYLDNPRLHLPENGFALLQAKTDLFRSDAGGFPIHLRHQPEAKTRPATLVSTDIRNSIKQLPCR